MIGGKPVGSVNKNPLKKQNKPTPFPKRLWRVLPGWKRDFTFPSHGRWDIFGHNTA